MIKVNTVDVSRPPIITQAIDTLVSEPAVIANAVGSIPAIIVIVVINIGFNLTLPASITASRALRPLSISVKV